MQPPGPGREQSAPSASDGPSDHPARHDELWEAAFSQANVERATARVVANGGVAGTDGMEVADLPAHLHRHWPAIRQQLDQGTYRPQPLRRVTIPKPGGGKRDLGVPTALDRLLTQAIAQVLTPVFDAGFSESSFGFRPGRSAHMAVERARSYIEDGWGWVVDLDLDSFFDRVNHDMLMARVARRVGDKRLLRLIRRYLEAGVLVDGVKVATEQGTPQGSPLSPLLSNVMLDDLDRELERRDHRFVRYADDIRIYVRTERAAARVLGNVTAFIEGRLRLKVNRTKSGTAPATKRGLLGFGFLERKGKVDVRIDPEAIAAMKDHIRRLTSRTWGVSLPVRIAALNRFIRGWVAYFALADTPSTFEKVDQWLRRRLRQVHWKQWKRPKTRRRMLRSLGIPAQQAQKWASSGKGSWRIAGSAPLQRALPTAYFVKAGLVGFGQSYGLIRERWRTA